MRHAALALPISKGIKAQNLKIRRWAPFSGFSGTVPGDLWIPRRSRSTAASLSTRDDASEPDVSPATRRQPIVAENAIVDPPDKRTFKERRDPFGPVRAALNSREKHHLHELLDLFPATCFEPDYRAWPFRILTQIMMAPADPASLIRLLPIVQTYANEEELGDVIRVTRLFLQRLRLLRMLAAVPAIMDITIFRLETAVARGEVSFENFMGIIRSRLRDLRKFRFFSRLYDLGAKHKTLPDTIAEQVRRLAELAISPVENQPTSSSNPILLSHLVRRELFSPELLTPEVRAMLLRHLPHVSVSPSEWRACAFRVIWEDQPGSAKLAEEYIGYAQQAARRMQKTDKSGTTCSMDMLDQDDLEITAAERVTHQEKLRKLRITQDEMDQLVLARCGVTVAGLVESLGPQLFPGELKSGEISRDDETLDTGDASGPLSAQRYAWSTLLNRMSKMPDLESTDIMDVESTLAEEYMVPHVMTPIIHGLVRRGDLQTAWSIFQDLAERQRDCNTSGRYIDRQLLSVATRICGDLFGFEAAVELVDRCGRRSSSDMSSIRSITLDEVNLNALLQICVNRDQPHLADRLFAAALPRWGIYPDGVSIKLLLDVCRSTKIDAEDEGDFLRERWRELVNDMRLFQPTDDVAGTSAHSSARHDLQTLSKGSHTVLLDDRGSSWRAKAGLNKPWQTGRQIFRDVLLGNWPHLSKVKSPFDFSSPFITLDRILAPSLPPLEPGELRPPLPTAQYMHIIPKPETFQSYITMLGLKERFDEIPLALAWMRELEIQPNYKSMCSALAFISGSEGPTRFIRKWTAGGGAAFVGDEALLRRWLEHWVSGPVPTEGEVAAFVRSVQEKSHEREIQKRSRAPRASQRRV